LRNRAEKSSRQLDGLEAFGPVARPFGSKGSRARRLASVGAITLLLVTFFALASDADAAHYQRPFKEVFGTAAQPSVPGAKRMVVDRKTGDVLVFNASTQTISRFNADGTAAPFTALGTNVIDGMEANGKPCSEEPASCDQTPQNGLEGGYYSSANEIAVDESEGPTKGDIYITQTGTGLVDIFAADGGYLGQLTAAGLVALEEPTGVAVDSVGNVYVVASTRNIFGRYLQYVYRYQPSGGPPVNSDLAQKSLLPEAQNAGAIALGAGPTAGLLFAAGQDGQGGTEAYEVDLQTGEEKYKFAVGEVYYASSVAVDPNTGTVLMQARENPLEVLEFEASQGTEPVRIARAITQSTPSGIAVTAASDLLLTESGGQIGVYGSPGVVPSVTIEPAKEVIGTKADLGGTVSPTGLPVTGCFFEYGETTSYGKTQPCEGTIGEDSSTYPVTAELSGLKPNGQNYHFRLVATNANGVEDSADQTLTTATTVITEAASAIGASTATLNGTVLPEGAAYGECFFEYGRSSNSKFEKVAPCSPGAAAITPDYSPHEVKAKVSGLEVGSTYRFRLIAKNSFGRIEAEELTFDTQGAPLVSEVRAQGANQSSVMLEGEINPRGFDTAYRFEWGTTSSYDHSLPVEFEPFVGSGETPVRVSVNVSGLSAGTSYHYRITARSKEGVTASPDQLFETLNACNLPEARCDELVSRRGAGPIAIPGEAAASAELHYQAATEGPGLAYLVEAGYPEATKGAEVLYRALRGPSEWISNQLSAPITAPNEQIGAASGNSAVGWLSNDLSCGIQQSFQPLTNDPGMLLVREYGGSNLYRINTDGSHTAVTFLAPENPEISFGVSNYNMDGGSQNCSKLLFETGYHYPGVPAPEGEGLYEWEEGALRDIGFVPAPGGGEVLVHASAGSGRGDTQNVVSEDGSRVFFTALRQTSSNPAEINQAGVFVRENVGQDGSTTRDVSESETATPDTEATYQWATPDGAKVFFTANAGLTKESNTEGTDLYEYDLQTGKLADLTVDHESGKAEVGGLVAASPDGSHVYFVAREQLLPGRGNTYAQNIAQSTFSIYGESGGKYGYVGKVAAARLGRMVIADARTWSSEVSPDGRYLLFESTLKNTDYNNPTGAQEVYLYDSEEGSEGTICVSCRQDGQPSVAPPPGTAEVAEYTPLPTDEAINNYMHQARFLTEREGRPVVFFVSADSLAPGAVENQNNVFEWSHGQVFRFASAISGQQRAHPGVGQYALFVGASEDGSDAYFITPETLTWEDGDERISAYDARIGGGFPEPAAPPVRCDASAEGSCQSSSSTGTVVPRVAATEAFSGPGSPEQQQPKQQQKKTTKKRVKKKPKKKGKKGKKMAGKQKSSKSKRKSTRQVNGNRRKSQ
jgi:Beta-propeller repeat